MSKFRIYKASAGSGKTFSLVYEYLKILILDPAEYKHILAVTFTNDATEEMKTRVLNQLKLLAENPTGSPYTRRLEDECLLETSIIQKRATSALSHILHDYSNFHISTIDTFFQKILRAFAKDIGLSAAYNLQLDAETAVEEVTEKVIAQTTSQNKQAKWLMNAALEKIEEGKSWNIREELKDLFRQTFKENYQVKEEKIKDSFLNENRIEELQKRIREEMENFEHTLQQIAKDCHALLSAYQLTRSSFSGKDRSFYGWVQKIGEGDMAPPGNAFINAMDHVDKWYTKSGDAAIKETIIQVYDAGLNNLVKKLYTHYTEHISAYHSHQLIRQNLAYFVMFESMVDEMTKYKDEHDILFISDTNQFISEVIGNNDESFIFEKAGNYFHHYLIDEFQDTSQLQWKNFRPLISNAVSQGYTSLVVGDVKQSIYRFRNGDWKLLHEQAGKDITYHEVVHLQENYRSLENIIRFNNTLYQITPGIVANIYTNDTGLESEWEQKFKECYTDQEQQVPEKNKHSGGYIKVNLFTPQQQDEEEHTVLDQKLDELVHDIENALQRGYRPCDMAILVFTKKEAYTAAAHLRKYTEEHQLGDTINIVTQSALNISNSHTVRLLMAALKYLLNRKDEMSLSHVFAEYTRYFLHQTEVDFLQRDTQEKIEEFRKKAWIIKSFPLQLLVDYLIQLFQLDREQNEHIFLQHFKDALIDYLRKNADDLQGFLEWWEESYEKFQVEVPQNEKSLQIITIHKSKGLEFDLVFIPFAEWGLDNSGLKADLLWLDVKEEGIGALPVKYDRKMLQSSFHEDYLQTKFYNYLDKLNLLYVATTRAVRELYIYSDQPKSFHIQDLRPNIKTIFSHILQVDLPVEGDQYLHLFAYKNAEGNQLIIGEKTTPVQKHSIEEAEALEAPVVSGNIFENLAIRQQSADLRDGKEVKQETRKQTGILFHEVMANSNTKEEALHRLKKLWLQRIINQEVYERFIEDFEHLFTHPLMQEWLLHYTSYAEYSFCVDGHIIKPDKFFLHEKEVIVIDFKTGQPMPEYAAQVQAYCRAANALFSKPAKGYIFYTQTRQFEPIKP